MGRVRMDLVTKDQPQITQILADKNRKDSIFACPPNRLIAFYHNGKLVRNISLVHHRHSSGVSRHGRPRVGTRR
jgi:hypothetical protein